MKFVEVILNGEPGSNGLSISYPERYSNLEVCTRVPMFVYLIGIGWT